MLGLVMHYHYLLELGSELRGLDRDVIRDIIIINPIITRALLCRAEKPPGFVNVLSVSDLVIMSLTLKALTVSDLIITLSSLRASAGHVLRLERKKQRVRSPPRPVIPAR